MEFWLLVWIFYLIFVVITCVYMSYLTVKSGINKYYKRPILVTTIVLLGTIWPVTLPVVLYTKGKKDHKEGDKDEDY